MNWTFSRRPTGVSSLLDGGAVRSATPSGLPAAERVLRLAASPDGGVVALLTERRLLLGDVDHLSELASDRQVVDLSLGTTHLAVLTARPDAQYRLYDVAGRTLAHSCAVADAELCVWTQHFDRADRLWSAGGGLRPTVAASGATATAAAASPTATSRRDVGASLLIGALNCRHLER